MSGVVFVSAYPLPLRVNFEGAKTRRRGLKEIPTSVLFKQKIVSMSSRHARLLCDGVASTLGVS